MRKSRKIHEAFSQAFEKIDEDEVERRRFLYEQKLRYRTLYDGHWKMVDIEVMTQRPHHHLMTLHPKSWAALKRIQHLFGFKTSFDGDWGDQFTIVCEGEPERSRFYYPDRFHRSIESSLIPIEPFQFVMMWWIIQLL